MISADTQILDLYVKADKEKYKHIENSIAVTNKIRTLVVENGVETKGTIFSSSREGGFLVLKVMGIPVLYKSLMVDTIDYIALPIRQDILKEIDAYNKTVGYPFPKVRKLVRKPMDEGDFLNRVRLLWRAAGIFAYRKGKWTVFTTEKISSPVYLELGDTYNFPESSRIEIPFIRSGYPVAKNCSTRSLTNKEYREKLSSGEILSDFSRISQASRNTLEDSAIYTPVVIPSREEQERREVAYAGYPSVTPTGWYTSTGPSTGMRSISGTGGTVYSSSISWAPRYQPRQYFSDWADIQTPRDIHRAPSPDVVIRNRDRDREQANERAYREALRRAFPAESNETWLREGIEALTQESDNRQQNIGRRDRPFYRRERY